MCPPPATITPATTVAAAPQPMPGLALLRDAGGSLPAWREQARADLADACDAAAREELLELLSVLDALAPLQH